MIVEIISGIAVIYFVGRALGYEVRKKPSETQPQDKSEWRKQYYQKNRKKILAEAKKYRRKNRDKINAYAREYQRKRRNA